MPALNVANPANAATATKTYRFAARAETRGACTSSSERQLEHGARAIAAVINASIKLQRLRDRTVALERALARMKARQAGSAA